MLNRSVTHDTFVIERNYAASPARVFHAWTDPIAKSKWFVGPDGWETTAYEIDFREGGHEINRGGSPGGTVHNYEARFYDIVPDYRIVYTYEMHLDGKRISVSLNSVVFEPDDNGTRLILTEHGAYLDGFDGAVSREKGTRELLDALGNALANESAAA
jgi:uncharacterized protein YndB with AHSA1/START domain